MKQPKICALYFSLLCCSMAFATLPPDGYEKFLLNDLFFEIPNIEIDPLVLKRISVRKLEGEIKIESSSDNKMHVSFQAYGMGGIKVWLQADPKRKHRWVLKSYDPLKTTEVSIRAQTVGYLTINGRQYYNGVPLHPHILTTTIKIPDEYRHLIKGMKH